MIKRHIQSGFTLIEMVIVVPIMVVAIAITITFMVNILLSIGAKNAVIALQVESQSALFTIKDDIMFANFFEGTIQPNETDPYAPAGGWRSVVSTGGGNYDKRAFILSEIAYTANRQTPTRAIVKVRDAPAACGGAVENNQSSTNTIIIFKSGDKLYRRVVIPDQSQNCTSTYRKQTCPPASATVLCPADTVLAENVKSFDFTYYSSKIGDPDVPVTNDKLTDYRNYIRITRADLEIVLERMINGEPTTATAKITLTKAE